MPPVRVAYLVGYYPAVSHTFITREVDGLRARGHEVHTFSLRRAASTDLLTEADRRAAQETYVVLPPAPGRLLNAHGRALLRSPGAYVRALGVALRMSAGGLRNGLWQLFYFVEAVLLAEELRRRGVRHLHAHFANAASAVALLAAEVGRADGLRWSFTMHGPTEFDDVTRYALTEKVRRAAWVACISDYCRSQLMKLATEPDWSKLEIVHCGVESARLAPTGRQRLAGGFEILCVGRLVPDKGLALLVDAAADLRRRGLQARLTFVGDGPDRASLEARTRRLGLESSITFAGAVGQDRIRELYGQADVFCLPSFAEGVPVVLMEAMATGLPVVTTRIMGIPELVRDGDTGLLVRPGRRDELTDALARLADEPDLRRRLGEAGRSWVKREYDITESVEALERLFARSAERGRP